MSGFSFGLLFGLGRFVFVIGVVLAFRSKERAADNPRRDAGHQESIDAVEGAYADLLDALPPLRRRSPDVVAIGWMIEELRISLFAQSIGTAQSVSAKRVRAAIAAVPT